MSHGPHTQTPFESAVSALADDWQKSYADLSPESQTTVRTLGIGQQIWDALNVEGRANLAADFDAQHDPATKELREELWRLEVNKAALLDDKEKLSNMPVHDPANFQIRRQEVELIGAKLGQVELQFKTLISADEQPVIGGVSNDSRVPRDQCVTKDELVSVFPLLKASWFNNLADRKWLSDAHQYDGVGGRRNRDALFCPYLVMLGLQTKVRCVRLTQVQGWHLLKTHFVRSYDAHRQDDPKVRRAALTE